MKPVLLLQPGICEIRLDGAPGNVLDREACEEIARLVRQHASDPACKAIVFSAAGKHFSYGASVPEHREGPVRAFLPSFHAVFAALIDVSVPTIAAVRGLCLGGAFELAAFCNFVVADSSAQFGVPEIQLGVFPPVACALFPWRFGGALSDDLILSGRRMGAEEAARRGVISRLASEASLEERLGAFLAESILPHSASSLRLAQRELRKDFHRQFLAALEQLERAYLEELMSTHDAAEGIDAFLQRRPPVWTNA